MDPNPEMMDIFHLTELRAPYSPEAESLRRNYIRDDVIEVDGIITRTDIYARPGEIRSSVAEMVYRYVFCGPGSGPTITSHIPPPSNLDDIDDLIEALLGHLTPHEPICPPYEDSNGSSNGAKPLPIIELERRAHIKRGDLYYLLPERMEHIDGVTLFPALLRAQEVLEKARSRFALEVSAAEPADLPDVTEQLLSDVIGQLEAIFDGQSLRKVVFEDGVHSKGFSESKRALFDTLYMLYILRRHTSVNLEHVIDGLRVLHVLEALAIDGVVADIQEDPSSGGSDDGMRDTLEALFPELRGWNGTDALTSLPLIRTQADFEAFMSATPVVHPIFARLRRYRFPFNDLKPLGIGDMKVVKQWLVAYLPGEISHVENILKNEVIDRTHRRLEKTEETFSFSSSSREWSQKDMQATERFELKNEVDNIVKTETGLGATSNVTLTYPPQVGTIVANVGANFSYKRDTTDQTKTSFTVARETVDKAVEQVEKNVAEARSIAKQFETEETNKHGFDNKGGDGHVTGIYRWLDKKYKAQLFNYGKRMMFEFIIPEPAAFFVESRLGGFEATLECPKMPTKPKWKTAELDFTAAQIDESKFKELRQKYDLSELSYPAPFRSVYLTDVNGHISFTQKDLPWKEWSVQALHTKLGLAGYEVTKVELGGLLQFHSENSTVPEETNTLQVELQNQPIGQYNLNVYKNWNFDAHVNHERIFELGTSPVAINTDEVTALVRLQNIWNIVNLTMRIEARPSEAHLANWRFLVYDKIRRIEQEKLDAENQEALLAYNSEMSEYRRRVDELRATTVNDLLQGQSEAYNHDLIRTELKKHSLALLTKEFDADESDDLLPPLDAVQDLSDEFFYSRFEVKEIGTTTTCAFEKAEVTLEYPSVAIEQAKQRGRMIQFLEQAFEWQQLAYAFYPYFWADRPDWIAMMSRADDADPNMTSFLQAGSAKVVLAVTPAYEEAVLHYLATREPWEGGPAPVIGDPLFIPLHEELRKRQDDLLGATAEGEPWTFTLPTSLIYLDGGAPLPQFPDVPG